MASAVLLRALGAAALRACLQAIACPARSPLKALSVWRALQPALVVAALRAWRLLPAPVMAPPAGPRPEAARATAWQAGFGMARVWGWRPAAGVTSAFAAGSRRRAPSALQQPALARRASRAWHRSQARATESPALSPLTARMVSPVWLRVLALAPLRAWRSQAPGSTCPA